GRLRAGGGAEIRAARARPLATRRVRVPAHRRVRERAAAHRHRQDHPPRAPLPEDALTRWRATTLSLLAAATRARPPWCRAAGTRVRRFRDIRTGPGREGARGSAAYPSPAG